MRTLQHYLSLSLDIRSALFNDTEINKETVVLKLLTLLLSDCIIESPFEKDCDQYFKFLERAIEYFDVTFFDKISNFDTNEIDKEVSEGMKELAIQYKLYKPKDNTIITT